MKANAVNLATFTNALCHRNATPLSVAMLAPCACGRNGQSKNGAVFGRETSLSLSLSLSLVSFLFAIYFVNFLKLFVRLVSLSVATQRVARRKPQQKNPHKLKENLPFLDTSLSLSMTNSGFCLKIMDIFTQILKQKFKFFTQNSRHFVNSNHFINPTHFITLSQILSLMQGFFIFLPQVFAQCKLINFNTRRKNGR